MSVQTMEGIEMFHRLGCEIALPWERLFMPISPSNRTAKEAGPVNTALVRLFASALRSQT